MTATKRNLDLKKVRDTIFEDITILLDELDVKYEANKDNVFMPCPIHGGDNPNGLSISLTHKNCGRISAGFNKSKTRNKEE